MIGEAVMALGVFVVSVIAGLVVGIVVGVLGSAWKISTLSGWNYISDQQREKQLEVMQRLIRDAAIADVTGSELRVSLTPEELTILACEPPRFGI